MHNGGISRVVILQCFLRFCCLIHFSYSSFASATEKLAVFYPSFISVQDREKALKSDDKIKSMEPMVFAKLGEFLSANEAEPRGIVIVPSSFPKFVKGYKPVWQFTKDGKRSFQFLILTLDSKWTRDKISEASLGVVEELGRKETKSWVEQLLGVAPKNIKRVTSLDDLFPLLALGNVEYVLISPENYEKVKSTFQAKTIIVGKSHEVFYPVVCAKEGIPSLKTIPADVVKALGFNGVEDMKN